MVTTREKANCLNHLPWAYCKIISMSEEACQQQLTTITTKTSYTESKKQQSKVWGTSLAIGLVHTFSQYMHWQQLSRICAGKVNMHAHLEIGVPGNVATIVNNTLGQQKPQEGWILATVDDSAKLHWWIGLEGFTYFCQQLWHTQIRVT